MKQINWFILIVLLFSCNETVKKVNVKIEDEVFKETLSSDSSTNIVKQNIDIIENLINVFNDNRYTLDKKGRENNTTEYFLDYERYELFELEKILYLDYYNFKKKSDKKFKPGVSVFAIIFNNDYAGYEYILATNILLEKKPDNFKAPAFYTKKKDILYLFRPHAFAFLKEAKEMKKLCDSLVIKPDTADIRMANECTYNKVMDTYYKTK